MRQFKVAFALTCVLALQGCAAAALSVAGMAGGAGIDHTLNGIVYRTYAAPIAGMRLAAHETLRRMGMKIQKSAKEEEGWKIEATATERVISIDLEALSNKTTRARVIVSRADFIFIKDSSTGNEIIDQMSLMLSKIPYNRMRLASAQMMLNDLGYDPGVADGLMGHQTRNAILRFQSRNDIRVDGKVSPELISMLERKQAAKVAARAKARQKELGYSAKP